MFYATPYPKAHFRKEAVFDYCARTELSVRHSGDNDYSENPAQFLGAIGRGRSCGIFGIWLHIDASEWAVLIMAMTAVFVAEAFNTAIEIDIDLTSPDYHPYARDTKDVAAGAVLITVLGAIVVGLIIFLPKLLPLLPLS